MEIDFGSPSWRGSSYRKSTEGYFWKRLVSLLEHFICFSDTSRFLSDVLPRWEELEELKRLLLAQDAG